jgi:hypothetical protein
MTERIHNYGLHKTDIFQITYDYVGQIKKESRGLRHELSSPTQILGSWVRIPLNIWMSVCVYSVFVLFCVWVAALQWADSPTKESYRLCIDLRKLKNWLICLRYDPVTVNCEAPGSTTRAICWTSKLLSAYQLDSPLEFVVTPEEEGMDPYINPQLGWYLFLCHLQNWHVEVSIAKA